MKTSVAAAVGAGVTGMASAQDSKDRDDRELAADDTQTPGAPSVVGDLKRFSTTAFGAEMTGPFVFADGSLLHSIQHPHRGNPEPFNKAGVGYYKGFAFEFDGDNDDFEQPSPPEGEEQDYARAADTEFEYLIQEGDSINGGTENWGITQTPEGTNVTTDNFAGTTYGPSGYNPDCNQFVATDEAGTEGYLFTNDENSPGNIARTPLSQNEDGEWEADAEDAMNLPNMESFREIGGTRINCYGDLSPWETPISSEEHYAHPRVSLTKTPGDVAEADSGEGILGAAHFWNRPNPTEIQGAVDDYAEVSGWYIQGYWNMDGVEHLAYHLGAEPVDQNDDNTENTLEPIGEGYPNPYDYGYHVDIRDPAADEPTPIKYYAAGRASWESPDIQADLRTIYGCSDGDSKGIYKFVADEEIPSYDDPMDVEGTLYAPKITNDAATSGDSPANTPIDIEWMEMGHASNGEVADWIAEYEDVTQIDYIQTHTDIDWDGEEGTLESFVKNSGEYGSIDEIVKEADLNVVENGNQNYITTEEILEWADQWESEGPDGVDDDLRKVPFLETRAAAKAIGASIEFNKAEGIDSVDGAGPGDFVYVGISEFNDDMANDGGDLALDRVDGGVVYRAELESDYNISRLEPVIVGPDFTGEEAMEDVDNALRNVDNVYAMRDGRVLCCEDGFQGANRSYPNDGLFVYQPPVSVDVESAAVRNGESVALELGTSTLPAGFSGAKVTVEVTNPDVAEITDASYADALGVSAEPEVASDGSSITVRTADIEKAVQSGAMNVTLATLEVEGTGAGTTDLRVDVEDMDDEAGADIDAQERSGIVITGPPAIGGGPGGRPPTDPDGDGRYEDVNGNGRLDYDDVTLLFEEFESDAVTMNVTAYDFNENGKLDYDDVVELYEEIN